MLKSIPQPMVSPAGRQLHLGSSEHGTKGRGRTSELGPIMLALVSRGERIPVIAMITPRFSRQPIRISTCGLGPARQTL